MPVLQIQSREEHAIETLSLRVRLMSERQLAKAYWRGDRANARKRLKRLVDVGLLARITVVARPVTLVLLLCHWRPGDQCPDFGALSYAVRLRWSQLPARPTTAYIATPRGRAFFGAPAQGRLKHPLQATHDLALAQAWLELHLSDPAAARRWIGEDLFATEFDGQKCPDAMLVSADGRRQCVVEGIGGYGYDSKRLSEFHRFCDRTLNLPYQLFG